MAIATMAAGTIHSINKSNQMISASNKGRRDGQDKGIANQNKLAREGLKRKQEGTILGGSASAQAQSEQGTMLTESNKQRSLLG